MPHLQSPADAELVSAARRFNATGAIWASTVLPTRPGRQAREAETLARLFELHERSCAALTWHLRGASRRHDNPLKVVSSFVGGACNPDHAELAALGALWSLPENRRKHIQEAFDDLARRLASVLERGRSDRSVRSCDCHIAAQLILGLVLWTPAAAHQAPPRKLLNRRRLVEGLQDLLIYGRAGPRLATDRPSAPAFASQESLAVVEDSSAFPLIASRIINRAGAEALTPAAIAAELSCSEDEARGELRKLRPVLVTCQQRAIGLVLRIRDSAFADADRPQSAFFTLIRGLTEAYLRDDVQPLTPLAVSRAGTLEMPDLVRMRWQTTWDLLRQRQVDGVGRDEVRERFHDLAPVFASAICAFLCSGLWAPGAQEIKHAASEVADLAWLGLAPRPS